MIQRKLKIMGGGGQLLNNLCSPLKEKRLNLCDVNE